MNQELRWLIKKRFGDILVLDAHEPLIRVAQFDTADRILCQRSAQIGRRATNPWPSRNSTDAGGSGYANRSQHADDLGPPSHNLTARLHPVQVRMQQRLEHAPITLDDHGVRE